jgi:hypothetical protein
MPIMLKIIVLNQVSHTLARGTASDQAASLWSLDRILQLLPLILIPLSMMMQIQQLTANSICMFKQDTGFPLADHTATNYMSVTKNTKFVIRWGATIGNCDYFIDYVFSHDRTVEIKVRASGCIQGTPKKEIRNFIADLPHSMTILSIISLI